MRSRSPLHLHALLVLLLTALRHVHAVHDVLSRLHWCDFGCLSGRVDLILRDMTIVTVLFVWLAASTTKAHNCDPPPWVDHPGRGGQPQPLSREPCTQ